MSLKEVSGGDRRSVSFVGSGNIFRGEVLNLTLWRGVELRRRYLSLMEVSIVNRVQPEAAGPLRLGLSVHNSVRRSERFRYQRGRVEMKFGEAGTGLKLQASRRETDNPRIVGWNI